MRGDATCMRIYIAIVYKGISQYMSSYVLHIAMA